MLLAVQDFYQLASTIKVAYFWQKSTGCGHVYQLIAYSDDEEHAECSHERHIPIHY